MSLLRVEIARFTRLAATRLCCSNRTPGCPDAQGVALYAAIWSPELPRRTLTVSGLSHAIVQSDANCQRANYGGPRGIRTHLIFSVQARQPLPAVPRPKFGDVDGIRTRDHLIESQRSKATRRRRQNLIPEGIERISQGSDPSAHLSLAHVSLLVGAGRIRTCVPSAKAGILTTRRPLQQRHNLGARDRVRTCAFWRLQLHAFPAWLPVQNLVDLVGIEPTTSSMPWMRAPSCAIGPNYHGGVEPRSRRNLQAATVFPP